MVTTDREVLYEKVEVTVFEDEGDLFTEEASKLLLGWDEPDEGKVFDIYLFKDLLNRTIHCSNVSLQRPFSMSLCKSIMWEILSGNWEFNLETIIIGRTGIVLDGQHRLIALILACQEYRRNPDRYPFWNGEPAVQILIALGAKESRKVANTIGTGKPRSLADSLYASGLFDQDRDKGSIKQLCRMAMHTMRVLWKRLGAEQEAYTPRYSHADALEFIERHPTMLECIRTIHEEEGGGSRRLSSISGAYAPALLYLMAASGSNQEDYHKSDSPGETNLDLSMLERAEEYWVRLAHIDDSVKAVVDRIYDLNEDGNQREDERTAILIKGWNAYIKKGNVTSKDITLKVAVNEFGQRNLLEDPVIEGVDVGSQVSAA